MTLLAKVTTLYFMGYKQAAVSKETKTTGYLSEGWTPSHIWLPLFIGFRLSDLVKPYVPARSLRFKGSFHATLWNSLPTEIRQACSVRIFKAKLKTHLFTATYES